MTPATRTTTGTETPRRKRRWLRRRGVRWTLLTIFLGGPLLGWIYEQYAVRRDAKRFPPPGRWSDRAPSTIPVSMLAEDLGKLLNTLSPQAPAILVASSIGGLPVEYFAREHPERVAGLVFLDAGNSEAVRGALKGNYIPMLATLGCSVVRVASAIALVRLFDPWNFRGGNTEQSARSAAVMYGAKPWVMLCAMVRAGEATASEFDEAPPLRRDIPITALSAETREEFLPPALAGWIQLRGSVDALRETHQRLAKASTRGVWRMVPGSSHLIASSQPQAAIDAVADMISASRVPDPESWLSASAHTAGH